MINLLDLSAYEERINAGRVILPVDAGLLIAENRSLREEVTRLKAPPELKGAREALKSLRDLSSIAAYCIESQLGSHGPVMGAVFAKEVADKAIAAFEVLPPDSPTGARVNLDDLDIIEEAITHPKRGGHPAIGLDALKRVRDSVSGAKPGSGDISQFPEDFQTFIKDGGWVGIPMDKLFFGYAAFLAAQKLARAGDTPVSPNRYGVDIGYFHAELAALSKSLPDRPADELSRYFQRLANVAAPVSLVSPAPGREADWARMKEILSATWTYPKGDGQAAKIADRDRRSAIKEAITICDRNLALTASTADGRECWMMWNPETNEPWGDSPNTPKLLPQLWLGKWPPPLVAPFVWVHMREVVGGAGALQAQPIPPEAGPKLAAWCWKTHPCTLPVGHAGDCFPTTPTFPHPPTKKCES